MVLPTLINLLKLDAYKLMVLRQIFWHYIVVCLSLRRLIVDSRKCVLLPPMNNMLWKFWHIIYNQPRPLHFAHFRFVSRSSLTQFFSFCCAGLWDLECPSPVMTILSAFASNLPLGSTSSLIALLVPEQVCILAVWESTFFFILYSVPDKNYGWVHSWCSGHLSLYTENLRRDTSHQQTHRVLLWRPILSKEALGVWWSWDNAQI